MIGANYRASQLRRDRSKDSLEDTYTTQQLVHVGKQFLRIKLNGDATTGVLILRLSSVNSSDNFRCKATVPQSFIDRCGSWDEPDMLLDSVKELVATHLEYHKEDISSGSLPADFWAEIRMETSSSEEQPSPQRLVITKRRSSGFSSHDEENANKFSVKAMVVKGGETFFQFYYKFNSSLETTNLSLKVYNGEWIFKE